MTKKNQLTEAQLTACRTAIHQYLDNVGINKVVLLPEFEANATGQWVPVQGNGARPTATNGAFMRLGKKTRNLETNKPVYVYTNLFMDDEYQVMDLLQEHGAVVGGHIPTARIVIHESTTPFSRKDPSRDIKWVDKANKLACMKLDAETGEMRNIYRTTKAFFAVDGEYSANAVNKFIQHDNAQQLSDAAYQKFNQANSANSAALKAAARLAELKGKTALTAKEQEELASLS